ncbi:MAG: glutathione S-transferase family protein [Woeseia sp.]
MKLFWSPRTRAARAVWMLEEAGVPYERVLVDIRSPDRDDDSEFVAASPMGKVPALVDGDVRMSESAAICLYIADKYRDNELSPHIDDPDRGRFLYWMVFTPGVIEPAMADKFRGLETNRFQSGWGDFDLMIETLENGLQEGAWLLGEQFSAADVMVGSSAVFMIQFDMLPDSKVIEDYAARCLGRPAYQRALAGEED